MADHRPLDELRLLFSRECRLGVRERAVVAALILTRHNESGLCFPSLSTVAAKAGCSRPSAVRATKLLKSKKVIDWMLRPNRRGVLVRHYRIDLDKALDPVQVDPVQIEPGSDGGGAPGSDSTRDPVQNEPGTALPELLIHTAKIALFPWCREPGGPSQFEQDRRKWGGTTIFKVYIDDTKDMDPRPGLEEWFTSNYPNKPLPPRSLAG